MAKYLFQASYSAEGAKALLKEGGSARREAVEKAVESMGGTVEVFYYAFGDNDVFAIVDLPDHASTSAFSLLVSSSGMAHVKTTVLMTPEEVDQATEKTIDYRPPGG